MLFLFCTPFISERGSFNNAVTSIADTPHCVDITEAFNDATTFNDVNLNDGDHDLHYNQCISNT